MPYAAQFDAGLEASERFSGAGRPAGTRYNITPDKNSGIGDWSDDELTAYLSTGAAPGRANAAGPMAEVVPNSTQYLTQEDLRSIVDVSAFGAAVSGGETRPRAIIGPIPPRRCDRAARITAPARVNGAQLFVGQLRDLP